MIHTKYLNRTYFMPFQELLPEKNAKLGQQIKFTKKTPYVQLKLYPSPGRLVCDKSQVWLPHQVSCFTSTVVIYLLLKEGMD